MALIPRNPKINQGMGSEAAEAVFDFPLRRARIPSMNAAGTSSATRVDPGRAARPGRIHARNAGAPQRKVKDGFCRFTPHPLVYLRISRNERHPYIRRYFRIKPAASARQPL